MRRRFLPVLALFIAISVIDALSAKAQALPSKKEAAQILNAAANRSGLTSPGAPAFHLLAEIHYKFATTTYDGTYELYWAAQDRYREEFRLGPINSDYVALHDKLYVARAIPALTYPQWRVRLLSGLPGHAEGTADLHVSKVYAQQIGSENVICANLDVPRIGEVNCYSPATKDLVFEGGKSSAQDLSETVVVDSFTSFGPARVPRRRLSTIGTEESLEFVITTLDSLSAGDEALLVPPGPAFVWDWCTDPKLGVFPNNNFIMWLTVDRHPARHGETDPVGYYVHVRSDGSIEMLRALYQDGSIKPVTETYVLKDRLPIETCEGKPVEYEMIYPAFPAGPHSPYTHP